MFLSATGAGAQVSKGAQQNHTVQLNVEHSTPLILYVDMLQSPAERPARAPTLVVQCDVSTCMSLVL